MAVAESVAPGSGSATVSSIEYGESASAMMS
jgi:hypothetical protein